MEYKIHLEDPNDRTTKQLFGNMSSTSLEECDFVIGSRLSWGGFQSGNTDPRVQQALDSYRSCPKPVILFYITDHTEEYVIPKNVLLYRTSVYQTRLNSCERIMPFLWNTVSFSYILEHKPGQMARVGFCGQTKALPARKQLLDAYENCSLIKKEFIIRRTFWEFIAEEKTRIEFDQNLLENHFNLCCRGAGNFAMRFYQTLAAGRIPVLIDTDYPLPYRDEIPWDSIIIMKPTAEEVVAETVRWSQERDLEEVQRQCKAIFQEYFTIDNFLRRTLEDAFVHFSKPI